MQNKPVLLLGAAAVLISNYYGHIRGPFSIEFTPILLGTFTFLIFQFTTFRLSVQFLLIIAMIIINDLLLRFFAGGIHDGEGNAWILLSLFAGLIISLLIIIIYGFRNGIIANKAYWTGLLIGGAAIAAYIYQFGDLGIIK